MNVRYDVLLPAAVGAAGIIVLLNWIGVWRAMRTALFLCATPFMYLWLVFDFRNLRRVAEEVEPPEEVTYQPKNKLDALLQYFLLYVVRPVVIFVTLPIILLVGCFLLLISRGDEDHNDDTIW